MPCTGCIILQGRETGLARLISTEVQAGAGDPSDRVLLGSWQPPPYGAPASVALGAATS